MNNCFYCNKELYNDEGLKLLYYRVCNAFCLSKCLSLEQIKQLYRISK